MSLSLEARRPCEPGDTVLALAFHVRDTGIGICDEDIERIFMQYTKATFVQRDESGVDRHAGAGLGLSICKSIVELHRGAITVTSAPGEGSTFTVALDLPFAAPEPSASLEGAAPTQGRDDFSGCRVLVADDVAMNRDVVGGMLDSLGCIVVEVTAADRTRDLRPAC